MFASWIFTNRHPESKFLAQINLKLVHILSQHHGHILSSIAQATLAQIIAILIFGLVKEAIVRLLSIMIVDMTMKTVKISHAIVSIESVTVKAIKGFGAILKKEMLVKWGLK